MRRQLIATTSLIALAAILVFGVPLGLVQTARARTEALNRLEREADGIAAAASRGVAQDALDPWLRPGHAADVTENGRRVRLGRVPSGTVLSARSGATEGVRVTVYASASEVAHSQRQVWLLVIALAVVGTGAAAGLAVLQARRFIRPLERLARTSARLGAGDFSARAGTIDLPELDRVARALDAAAVQIAQLVGRQREFASNVSHQLRTPLTAMILHLDELATTEDPAAAREEIEAALRVGERLDRTVTDLLALARMGDIGEPRDVDLSVLACEHGEQWRPVFARAGRVLRVSAAAGLPARVSPGGVSQALDVLLENALIHGGGETRLQALSVGGRPALLVQDEGAGVPDELARAVFERAVSTAGSTGLGLPLARALVEADGGRLLLTQTRPARFQIVLPRPRPATA